jgi:hypothetical protein
LYERSHQACGTDVFDGCKLFFKKSENNPKVPAPGAVTGVEIRGTASDEGVKRRKFAKNISQML